MKILTGIIDLNTKNILQQISFAKISLHNHSLSVKFPKQAGYSWGFSFYDKSWRCNMRRGNLLLILS